MEERIQGNECGENGAGWMGSVMYKTADMTQMSASHCLNFQSYLTCYKLGPVLIVIVSVVLSFLGMYCPGVISVLCYFNTMC